MAINEHPDVRCGSRRHPPNQGPPAAGFLRGFVTGFWRPRCDTCIQRESDDLDPEFADVVYLDPTRQRRPDCDHHDHPRYLCPDAWTDPAL